MERQSIKKLMDWAPATLKRSGPSSLAQPDVYHEIYGFDYFRNSVDPSISASFDKIRQLSSQGKVKVWDVNSREILEMAIEMPKIVPSGFNKYFTDTDNLTRKLEDYVMEQRFGRVASNYSWKLEANPTSRFHLSSESWRRASYDNDASLWETGIIMEGADNIKAISVSYPWDKSVRSFYERLTPPPIFIGREKELNMFSQMISGKDLKDLEIASAFSANDLEVWWGQAKQINNVIKGSWRSSDMRMRPYFEERVLNRLKSKIPNRELHDAIQSSEKIYGYFVTARESNFPGAVDLTLHLDEKNWLESKTRRVVMEEPRPGSFEYKEKNQPATENMWIYGCGGIYNCRKHDDSNKDFSVFITLDNDTEDRRKRMSLQISQYLKLNDKNKRTKMFYINDSEFGDGVTYSKYTPTKKDVQPMDDDDYKKALELFMAAKKRAVVDSPTYWELDKRKGFAPKTQEILRQAEVLIKSRS